MVNLNVYVVDQFNIGKVFIFGDKFYILVKVDNFFYIDFVDYSISKNQVSKKSCFSVQEKLFILLEYQGIGKKY